MFKPLKCYLALALTLCLSLTACQNPGTDEPENPNNPEIPEEPETPSSPIVGTWTTGWDLIAFRSDGTGVFCEDYIEFPAELDYGEFKYVYDEVEQTITMYLRNWNGTYDEENPRILSYISIVSDNEITYGYLDDDDIYKLSRLTTPQAAVNVKPKGQIKDDWGDNDYYEYIVEGDAGSYYFDIEPIILWHKSLPALTLESSTAKYDPIQFNVSGNNPYVLTVSFTENTTANTKFSQIDLVFSNSNKSVSVTCPIVIYQNPAK